MDSVLPFGLRSAPKVFTAVADAVEWMVRQQGVENIYQGELKLLITEWLGRMSCTVRELQSLAGKLQHSRSDLLAAGIRPSPFHTSQHILPLRYTYGGGTGFWKAGMGSIPQPGGSGGGECWCVQGPKADAANALSVFHWGPFCHVNQGNPHTGAA